MLRPDTENFKTWLRERRPIWGGILWCLWTKKLNIVRWQCFPYWPTEARQYQPKSQQALKKKNKSTGELYNLIWKCKWDRIAKTTSKRRVRKHTLPDFKTKHALVINTLCYWYHVRWTDQWNRRQSTKTDPHLHW